MMPKTRKMKPHSAATDAIPGNELSSDCTRIFMPGTRLIVRSGRSSRMARSADSASAPPADCRANETQPATTTVASR